MIVYLLRNALTGQGYVGRTTTSLEVRFRNHRNAHRPDMPISVALDTYGPENFTIEALQTCTSMDELRAAEPAWVERLGTRAPAGYNLRAGDDWPPELRAKLGDTLRGREVTWGAKIAETMRGHSSTPAQLAVLEAGRIAGRTHPSRSLRNRNRKLTDDEVREIRRLVAEGGLSQREIGEQFGVQQSAVSKIARRATLARVLDED